jgi:CubicO group peptidase (beta-lactamase class C family)
MKLTRPVKFILLVVILSLHSLARAESASELLPANQLLQVPPVLQPITNSVFVPSKDSTNAPAFSGSLSINQTTMTMIPELERSEVGGRTLRSFPAITLRFVTDEQVLVPFERGQIIIESKQLPKPSYWSVIPQFGRVWHEKSDGEWNRAAFPIMLVNDTENHSHQGLATFLYKGNQVSMLRVQFIQQSGPYLVKPHFVACTQANMQWHAVDQLAAKAVALAARSELTRRLPTKPWSELVSLVPSGSLDTFGAPVLPQWQITNALLWNGTLYYQPVATPYGEYPYPLELRFGVRSVMKSIAAPLSLLRLAQVYGPYVLNLKIGDYVDGLDEKYEKVRFIDAANMASGFGGTGTWQSNPNNLFDGYLDGHYDDWYTAPSHAEKINVIKKHLKPYPWEPGTVVRYRDQDFYLLGIAIDSFLKTVRGPDADAWDMLQTEVLSVIGIAQAPAVRTRETGKNRGYTWFNAGYYPTLDDLAKIADLYQSQGNYRGTQLLHKQLTMSLLLGQGALTKSGDGSLKEENLTSFKDAELYKLGFHFSPYRSVADQKLYYLPTMSGSGENRVIIYPNGIISFHMAKAAGLPEGTEVMSTDVNGTFTSVEALKSFQ